MTAATDLGAAVQALTVSVKALAQDARDEARLMSVLAAYRPAQSFSADPTGAAQATAEAATSALCRRAALAALARSVAATQPASYDDAVSLRDQVCRLFELEISIAGDAGDDRSCNAMRALKSAIADDLTAKAANLSRLQTVRVGAPLPALVHAYRLYQDIGRADEVSDYADAPDPNALPVQFRALGR